MYDEHSLDLQRAYGIVCLMVGSDPESFRAIATRARMPEERQDSCRFDFDQAAQSWRALLQEHPRADQAPTASFLRRLLGWRRPAARSKVEYTETSARLAHYRNALMAAGVLEMIGKFIDDNLPFRKPISLKAMACDEPNAYWDDHDRQLVLCYELVAEYVDLALRTPDP
jgi:hypothetical protein